MSENQRIAQLEAEIERLNKRIEELLDANGYTALALAKAEDEIERLEAAVTSWRQVFEGIEAHLQDRINMGDPAEPKTYLSIIRSDVANINRDSDAIVRARWADAKRAADEIEQLRTEIERLRAEIEGLKPLR